MKKEQEEEDPFPNSRRGVEQWRCGICQSINDMADNECQGCHYDYDADTDSLITVSKIKKKKDDKFEFVTVSVLKDP